MSFLSIYLSIYRSLFICFFLSLFNNFFLSFFLSFFYLDIYVPILVSSFIFLSLNKSIYLSMNLIAYMQQINFAFLHTDNKTEDEMTWLYSMAKNNVLKRDIKWVEVSVEKEWLKRRPKNLKKSTSLYILTCINVYKYLYTCICTVLYSYKYACTLWSIYINTQANIYNSKLFEQIEHSGIR